MRTFPSPSLPVVLTLVLFGAPACNLLSRKAPQPPLLNPAIIHADQLLPGPPEKGSDPDSVDLIEVMNQQKSRTQEDCKRARYESDPSLEALFGPRYELLTKKQVEKLEPAFKRISDEILPIISQVRDRYPRGRPSVDHAEVKPCIKEESSSSYPSGQAVLSIVFAKTLALIYPDKEDEFAERAREANHDRVLSGLHYPSDVRDGALLGRAVFDFLSASPEFKKMIEELKK